MKLKVWIATLAVLFCMGISFSASAAVPGTMTYHGNLTDSSGQPVDTTVEATFRLYNAVSGGSEVWSETFSSVDVVDGSFSAQLGATDSLIDVFDGDSYWLEVIIDGETLSPRNPVESVPYALRSHKADDADYLQGLSADDVRAALDELAELRSRVESLESNLQDSDGDTIDVASLETRIAQNETDISNQQTLTQDMDRTTIHGQPSVTFTGVNVHVRNGLDATNGNTGDGIEVNGVGNLIVGYDEERDTDSDKSGSHNLVIGPEHNYTSYGGLVAGSRNAITSRNASVTGGWNNTASGRFSSVSGGHGNTASGGVSSISGGENSTASGSGSSVSGGVLNKAEGDNSSISGGISNQATGHFSSISGGASNTTLGNTDSVSGGRDNTTSGSYSAVSGGQNNTASGLYSTVSGGHNRSVNGNHNWRGGGYFNSN